MNNIAKKIIIFLLFILTTGPLFTFAEETTEYKLLEPLPGFEETITPSNPVTYIEALYWYALGLAVVLSVLMLVIGGLEYTTSFASESNKGKAKARIENALIGLVIALTSYLILYTVNPEMATLKLKDIKEACEAQSSARSAGSYYSTTGGSGTRAISGEFKTHSENFSNTENKEQVVRDELKNIGISVNKNSCPFPNAIDCTDVGDMGVDAVSSLRDLRNSCPNCEIIVTGGTEIGVHKTHGPNNNNAHDLRKTSTLNNYIFDNRDSSKDKRVGRYMMYTMPNGDKYYDEGTHFHAIPAKRN